jgi:GTP-binding protein HflX
VGVQLKNQRDGWDIEDSLAELAQLAHTAGLEVVGQTWQRLDRFHSATLIGSGKVDELIDLRHDLDCDVVLFDDELSPRQLRNLEDAFGDGIKIVDRTGLILDVFAQHARTREGQLQVELAQYQYRLPRLTRAWTHLARQAGGGAARGGAGGVGLRGPGETQLEVIGGKSVGGLRIFRSNWSKCAAIEHCIGGGGSGMQYRSLPSSATQMRASRRCSTPSLGRVL